jgi:hypothetical protein
MKDYLATYGNRKFQAGGPMPADPNAAPSGAPTADPAMAPAGAPPEGGGGGEEQIVALAQAAASGDMQAAAELGMMLAPLILEQAGMAAGGDPAMTGGAPPADPAMAGGPAPMGRGGMKLLRTGGKFGAPVFSRS